MKFAFGLALLICLGLVSGCSGDKDNVKLDSSKSNFKPSEMKPPGQPGDAGKKSGLTSQ